MDKELLVPLDGTPEAAAALPAAEALARARDARLVLLRVSPDDHPDSSAMREARAYLARAAEDLRGRGLRVETAVGYGDAAEAILAEAAGRGADLIVMATHGRGGLGRALLGSVTDRVLGQSPVPVLVLRPDERPVGRLRTLLVPLDGAPGGAAALAAAEDLARPAGARVVLLQVIPPLPRWGEGRGIAPHWEEAMRQGAQGILDLLARGLLHGGVAAQGRAAIGEVPQTIVAVAREVGADLIVMSTHALTGPRRALLGSVADAVVRTADQPVLLIRQTTGDVPEGAHAQ